MKPSSSAEENKPDVKPPPSDSGKPTGGVKRPRDLKELPLEVKPWPLKDRVVAAKSCVGSYDAKLVALAITLVEHPETITNGNCFDLMCKGQYEPWGVHRADIGRTIPAGYVMLDAETPILAFDDPKKSLQILIAAVERRRIFRLDEYAAFWRNLEPGSQAWGDAMLAFEQGLDATIRAYQ